MKVYYHPESNEIIISYHVYFKLLESFGLLGVAVETEHFTLFENEKVLEKFIELGEL